MKTFESLLECDHKDVLTAFGISNISNHQDRIFNAGFIKTVCDGLNLSVDGSYVHSMVIFKRVNLNQGVSCIIGLPIDDDQRQGLLNFLVNICCKNKPWIAKGVITKAYFTMYSYIIS